MNKTAIKNFAVWARTKLIADISYKAGMLGITNKCIAPELPQSTVDTKFYDIGTKEYAKVSGKDIATRNALAAAIREKERKSKYSEAYESVIEEVAYTWFNRLVAVRFMEVNDYLPARVRVLSSENLAKAEPDFVTKPFDTDMEFTDAERDYIIKAKDNNKLDELFRFLFIKQCNKLHEILPELFEQTEDYSELLLNISFTDNDGIVSHLVHDISEEDFKEQVQIVGWMYQYYISEHKDELINARKAYQTEDIPYVTQLFTSDWIVRYMVENSLGRLWLEGHSNNALKSEWKYYLDEAEQEADIQVQLEKIRAKYANIKPRNNFV